MAEQLEQFDLVGFNVEFGTYRKLAALEVNAGVAEFVEELIEVARKEWADDVWAWFDRHKEDRILKVRKWFLSFTFRVKHCEALIRLVAGPRP